MAGKIGYASLFTVLSQSVIEGVVVDRTSVTHEQVLSVGIDFMRLLDHSNGFRYEEDASYGKVCISFRDLLIYEPGAFVTLWYLMSTEYSDSSTSW